MPTKKSKKRLQKKKSLLFIVIRAFFIILIGVIALFAAIIAVGNLERYFWEKEQIKKEYVTFSRMEKFVNDAKVRLEKEIPEGKWEIEKYCEKPGSKGDIDEYNYGCDYKAVSRAGISNIDLLKRLAHEITNNRSVYIPKDDPTAFSVSMRHERDEALSINCGFMSWINDNGNRVVNVGCADQALLLRYPLRD